MNTLSYITTQITTQIRKFLSNEKQDDVLTIRKKNGIIEMYTGEATDWTPAPEDIGGEKRREVRIVEVDYICTECRSGRMRYNGMMYPTYPPQYGHKCDNCGHLEKFVGKTYPDIEYI